MQEEPDPVDEVLIALGGSHTLALLGLTDDDLELARTDPTLLETLSIAHTLLSTLRDEGVLEAFLQLPHGKQTDFVRWIGTIDGEEVRRALTITFVAALRESPLADGEL